MALKFPCKILLSRDFRMQKIVPHYHQRWNKILALFRQKHTQKLQMKYFKIRKIMHQPFIYYLGQQYRIFLQIQEHQLTL